MAADGAGLAAVTAELLRAVAAGELAPGEAGEVARIVEAHRRVVETAELVERIAARAGVPGGDARRRLSRDHSACDRRPMGGIGGPDPAPLMEPMEQVGTERRPRR